MNYKIARTINPYKGCYPGELIWVKLCDSYEDHDEVKIMRVKFGETPSEQSGIDWSNKFNVLPGTGTGAATGKKRFEYL